MRRRAISTAGARSSTLLLAIGPSSSAGRPGSSLRRGHRTPVADAGFTAIRCWLQERPTYPDDVAAFVPTSILAAHLARLPEDSASRSRPPSSPGSASARLRAPHVSAVRAGRLAAGGPGAGVRRRVRTVRSSAGTSIIEGAGSAVTGAGRRPSGCGRWLDGRHGRPLARITPSLQWASTTPAFAELLLVQPRVQATPGQKLVVCAAFDDRAVVDGKDDVGVANRREPVRDGDRGSSLDEGFERLLNYALAFRSSAEVASSRTRIGGSSRITRAIASRWRSPPENR